jgi:hypothetical protein
MHGRLGIGRWHRRERSLTLATAAINSQLVPTGIPAITAAARALARRWQPDALLGIIDYQRPDGPNPQPPSVRLSFFSPASGLGLWITVSSEGASFFGASRAIPNGFLDLPQAWAVARQYGVQPPLERATLQVWTPGGSAPVVAWSLSGARGGVNIDGVEGNLLEGDLSGYIAAYNAQGEVAIAGLRRLLARRRSSSPSSPDFGSDSPASSSSSSGGDDGPSGPDYGTASQSSWEANTWRPTIEARPARRLARTAPATVVSRRARRGRSRPPGRAPAACRRRFLGGGTSCRSRAPGSAARPGHA